MWNPFRRKGRESVRLQCVTVTIPYVGNATFVPDASETNAAWSLYIELSTRIGVQPFAPGYSSVREALSSVYAMFGETRRILSSSGPRVARDEESFAPLALGFLNFGLRPFLNKWHQELKSYEISIGIEHVADPQYEAKWPKFQEFIEDLEELKANLDNYCTQLLTISGAKIG